MDKKKTKIIVEHHYIGTDDETDVFRNILLNEVSRKLNSEQKKIIDNAENEDFQNQNTEIKS